MKKSVWTGMTVLALCPCFASAEEMAKVAERAQPATATPEQHGGDVLGILNSSFVASIGPDGRKVSVNVYEVSNGPAGTVCYLPPFGFDREALLVAVPDSRGWRDLTAKELVEELRAGVVDPRTPVVITLKIAFADSLEIRRCVLEASLAQGKLKLDEQAVAAIRAGNPQVINAKCVPLPIRSFSVQISHGSLHVVTHTSDSNPMLGSSTNPQVTLPAAIVDRMLSPTGASVLMRMQPLLLHNRMGKGKRQVHIDDIASRTMKELGKGGLSMSEDGGTPTIACQRNAVVDAMRSSKYTDDVALEGDDLALIDVVAKILQENTLDLPAVTEAEQETILREAADWERIAQTPGFLETLDRVAGAEEYSRKDLETLHSTITQHAKSSSGGGGLSLGFFAIGGGGGSSSSDASAQKDHVRKQSEELSSWLRKGRVTGKFPVPPNLNLCKVTKNAVQKQLSQSASIVLRGPAYADAVSQDFNTAFTRVNPKSLENLLEIQRRIDRLRNE